MIDRVLIVDDEENILRAIERLFIDEDYEVVTASSGDRALALLAGAEAPAVIISDQRMPGMSGAEFLGRAREIAPESLRMVLTGYADIGAAMDAVNLGGVSRYLTKPWDDAMLVQAVRDGVGLFRLRRENRLLQAVVERQNAELRDWNAKLKSRVLEQTSRIRLQNQELRSLNDRVSGNWRNTLVAFSSLLGQNNPLARHHARNVAALSEMIAREVGLPPDEVEKVRIAALLHDIGEIGIAPAILRKSPDAMSHDERARYRLHPVRGQAVVDVVEGLRDAGSLIRSHHERFDGGGFPDGLAGEAIPLGARVIAMADFIDRELARPGQGGAIEPALAALRETLGAQHDPSLYPVVLPLAREAYREVDDRTGMVEAELPPDELRPGMALAREVVSGTGLLLLAKGVLLDEQRIESLIRFYEFDPPRCGVFVLVRRKGQSE
jgi:response regulator RpfG family c-di-GMP phosphodiesterase